MCPVSTVYVGSQSIRGASASNWSTVREQERLFLKELVQHFGLQPNRSTALFVFFLTFKSEDATPAPCGLWVLSECMKEIQWDYLSNTKWRGVWGLSWGRFIRVYNQFQLLYVFTCSLVNSVRQWVNDGATLQFNFPFVYDVVFLFLCLSLFPAV